MDYFTAVVAYDLKRGIGKNNQLPWHIPEDLKHFKEVTKGHSLIMGRKTWDSLPVKPLPDRFQIVVTSQDITLPTAVSYPNPDLAFRMGRLGAITNVDHELFVIGGQSLYEHYKDKITRQIVTEVGWDAECDTFYPEIPGEWREDESLRKHIEDHRGPVTVRHLFKVKQQGKDHGKIRFR